MSLEQPANLGDERGLGWSRCKLCGQCQLRTEALEKVLLCPVKSSQYTDIHCHSGAGSRSFKVLAHHCEGLAKCVRLIQDPTIQGMEGLVKKDYSGHMYPVHGGEELSQTEALDSQHSQVTLGFEGKLKVVVDLVSP